MKYYGLLLLLVAGLFAGCDGAIVSEYKEQLVISGFIFPGEPIDSIIVRRTIEFGKAYDDLESAIDNATVKVTVDGSSYLLQPLGRKGRYGLPGSQLIVQAGKTYELEVVYNGQVASGSTTVPGEIRFIGLNDSLPQPRLYVFDTNNYRSFDYGVTAGPIDYHSRKYMLLVHSLDTTAGRIATSPQGPPVDTQSVSRYTFPETAPKFRISPRLFSYYGRQLITLIAMDTNWVDHRRLLFGPSPKYEPSLNHLTGALGVWASGAKDTVTIWVRPRE
jgi:hypothetical protein